MKKDIQPPFVDCQVTCACGNKFAIKATVSEIKTELCSKCHPFFTGEQVLIDTAGQVERFQKRTQVAQKYQEESKKKQPPKKQTKPEEEREETAEELLAKIKQQLKDEEKIKKASKEKKADKTKKDKEDKKDKKSTKKS